MGRAQTAAPRREVAAPQKCEGCFHNGPPTEVLAVTLDAERDLVHEIPSALDGGRIAQRDLQGWGSDGVGLGNTLVRCVEDVGDGGRRDTEDKTDEVEEVFQDTLHWQPSVIDDTGRINGRRERKPA